ncbi:glycosyltransferase [Planctomycetota bacterium]|nr:glycosyltransferase [Planctomycetota bacterium]
MDKKRYLVMTFGSHGDVFPMMGLCAELKARGCDVAFCSRPGTREIAESAGIEFIPSGDDAMYEENLRNPDIWHPQKAAFLVVGKVRELIDPSFEVIEREYEKHGKDLVVIASMLVLGARLAREKWDIKLVTVHLQPMVFRSTKEPPKFSVSGPDMRKFPRWVNRCMYWMMDVMLDFLVKSKIREWQKEHEIKPVKRGVFGDWIHSPDLVLGMFPNWFARKMEEWPEVSEVVGFPNWEWHESDDLSAELKKFLDGRKKKPVLITPGTANVFGGQFIEKSVETCRALGLRVLVATGYKEQVCELRDGEIWANYAPFEKVIPKCCAVLHHGGVGTTARCIGSGVPQLIMPLAHDQPDNAQRVKELGIGDWIAPKKFEIETVKPMLAKLIDDITVERKCIVFAEKVRQGNGIKCACDLIEEK